MSKSGSFGYLKVANCVIHLLSTLFLGEWALYGIFRCPFVVPFVSCQNCPVITCPGRVAQMFWGVWVAWLVLAIFLARSFCGWICPGGFVQRVLASNPFKAKLDLAADRTLAFGKYIFLALCILAYFFLAQPRVNVPIRIGEFWQAVGLTFEFAFPMWIFRTGLVLVGLACALFLAFTWCRFLCPMGGFLELVKPVALFRLARGSQCNDCDVCRHSCALNTRPNEENCTNCGDCISSCPKKCIHLKALWTK
ncbi:MAG: 4Fe-4S binding protein [Desulfovibrionaceae bacterium]|nr:4Fe-4S binding protein [Desulfovibrionaceae bacterium]